MKAITGFFESDKISNVVHKLMENGIEQNSLSTVSSEQNVPEYIEGEPEEVAADGAAIGAVIGGSVGMLGSAAASAIPGFETSIVAGFMGTAGGAALGTYLGSIYSVRANRELVEGKTMIDLLNEGHTLLIVTAMDDDTLNRAEEVLINAGAANIETHTVPDDE